MKALATVAALAAISIGGIADAQTTTLRLSIRVDDQFQVWLGASKTDPGVLLGSGSNWAITYRFTANLKPGQTYYLHIKGRNTGGPCGLIGSFHLSSPAFRFANGSQDLVTGRSGWFANSSGSGVTPWAEPTGAAISLGKNGASPWGYVPDIAPTAQWIWTAAGCNVWWANFSTTITPATAAKLGQPMRREKH